MSTVPVEVLVGIEHFLLVEDLELTVYLTAIVAVLIFSYGIYAYWKKWFYGQETPRLKDLTVRVKRLITYSILQRRVLEDKLTGSIHLLIFTGIILLGAVTVLRALEYDVLLKLGIGRILTGRVYLVYKLIANIGGVMVILGCILAFIRRVFKLTKDLPSTVSDYLVLLLLSLIVVTGFILDSIATLTYRTSWIGFWDPIGVLLTGVVKSWGFESLSIIYRAVWVTHLVLAMLTVAIIPYTKLSHLIVGGLFNTFYSRLEHPSAFKPIPEIEKLVEEGGEFGIGKLKDTTWKERMDYDSCIKCARCHNECPANISGKPLSPMELVLKFRELMDKKSWEEQVSPAKISPDTFWSCVTCGACVRVCPMLIHHVETILDVRRSLFARGEATPEELVQVSYNIMRTGNPYGFNPADREEWVKSLVGKGLVEIAVEGEEYDYIYWVGCNVSYDPNLRGVGESLLKLLKLAGLKVGVLLEEQCCGEPARRVGDELMFSEVVKSNSEMLSKYKFKAILVSCPHGYNVFKHEYPQYGLKLQVVHYTQLLSSIVESGEIKVGELKLEVTFHDPCYLGRWNGVYEEPRRVLRSIRGLRVVEMVKSRDKSFCCGGGGGHAFYELKRGERISKIRIGEVRDLGVKTVVVACPFCNVMLKSEAINYDIEVVDLAELLVKAIEE